MCVLCSFIYETEHHNGIAELLEILGRYDIFCYVPCVTKITIL